MGQIIPLRVRKRLSETISITTTPCAFCGQDHSEGAIPPCLEFQRETEALRHFLDDLESTVSLDGVSAWTGRRVHASRPTRDAQSVVSRAQQKLESHAKETE